MGVMVGTNKPKFQYGASKVKKIYKGTTQVYSSGNICTYYVDSGSVYQEEVDEGASCLSPKTFTPTKSGWTFVGWRSDATTNSNVYTSYVMGDAPVTLYAVFRQTITVTYYNASASASAVNGYRYYNNGNIANASFALSQAALAGWTARGWSTSSAANGGITYADAATFTRDSNITLYGMYQQTIALTTVANGSTSAQYGTRYYNSNGNTINPAFTVSNPVKSGAAFLGWSSGAGSTAISNSTISNLTLSASTTRWAVFKYSDSPQYSLAWAVAYNAISLKQHQGVTVDKKPLQQSAPACNTDIYENVVISTPGGTNVSVNTNDGGGWRYVYVWYSVGSNRSDILEKAGYSETWTGHGFPNPGNWNGQTVKIPLTPNGTQTVYLNAQLYEGNGFCSGGAYAGNSADAGYMQYLGRTVVG